MFTQGIRYTLPKPNLSFNGLLGWFHSDDYLSRVYAQLPALYSSVSSASFFGHGMHTTLTCRWQNKDGRWMLEARYGLLRYFDREEQGTGLQAIMSPWKNDLSFQIRVKI